MSEPAPFEREVVDNFVELLQEGAHFFVRWIDGGIELTVRTPDGKTYLRGTRVAALEFCKAVALLDTNVDGS